MHRLKRGFMMKCEKTAFCPGSCPTRRYLPSDCLFSRFLASEFRTKCLLLIITWRVPIRFEWRRWVHFYLNQETEIVITKKIKIVAQYRRQTISKMRELIENRKNLVLIKNVRFSAFYPPSSISRNDLSHPIWPFWPLDHYFLTKNQRFEIIRLKV